VVEKNSKQELQFCYSGSSSVKDIQKFLFIRNAHLSRQGRMFL